ncbi:erythrocyte membrane protein 1, PfEMP1, putative [Plasmodium sp. gorilla clade G2]|uniref:erythrocyte membrane protein 1, PfEMP1, putative n=1 Tax=Plasmodium sp. gorilla clade G2 TaxID=880535 RepID=UPI000D2C57A9|nr:erythrocyte membrane protein 1, PfEMP1, putative [Plasmodium sp. gorilla clade G2]SOV20305.1 erythrocyte membrane protein 1, PfEMP1, putative [Plasmodium sp. gorilla clade G2]
MGNAESNNKSSLLRNFQYLIVEDKEKGPGRPQHKLMYFDYLNFLKYEIDHEAWKWKIYKDYVTKSVGGSTLPEDEKLFCVWKKIQKEIFDKLEQQLKHPTQKKYKWEDDVLPLINIGEKKIGTITNCNNITINHNDIEELKKDEFPALSGGTARNCALKTAPNLHIPLRRRALLVKGINDYLEEIHEEMTSTKTLKDVIEGRLDPATQRRIVAVGMKKKMIDGLGIDFSKLIKEKYKETEHTAFCNEWYLTMDDYHTLFLGKDIVEENETTKIQCTIKKIENKVGKATDFQKEWSAYFKEIVQDLQTTHLKDPKTQKPCQIDRSEKSQCVRFFQEWAEEFCKLKKDLGEMILTNCKGPNTANSAECKNVCNIYTKFLDESKGYYENYKKICAEEEYGYDKKTELQKTFIDAAINSMKECCTDYGHCDDKELFKIDADNSNIRYKCFCPDGEYKKHPNTDTDNKCSQYKDPNTIAGTQLGPPTLSSSSQSVASAACGANSGRPPSATVEAIAKSIQSNIEEESKKGGNVGHLGNSELEGDISQAEFKNGGQKLNKNGICNLKKEEHTNDKRPYEANTTDGSNKHDGPCTGKGTGKGKDNHRFAVGLKWNKHQDVKAQHNDVLFPPRRLDMCTSNIENLDPTAKGLSDGEKAIHSLLGDVMLAAKYETEKIIDLYKQYNLNGQGSQLGPQDKQTICQAMKYSFADIGDIIRGRDIWTEEQGNKQLQERLKKIFKNIQDKVTQGSTYKNDPDPYTTLREYWWEANRKQIWKAMMCGNNNICDTKLRVMPPHDDYIPQRLRWLAEWSEWYCKKQKVEYDKVVSKCSGCKNGTNVSCTQCPKCKDACGEYTKFITDWKEDWQKMEEQYKTFYKNATENGSTAGSTRSNDLNKDYLNKFLKLLHDKNTQNSASNNPYTTAEGYIQQELKNGNVCEKQTEFCENKTGGANNDKYTFLTQPSDYVTACGCDSSTPCQIVDTILSGKDGTQAVGGCNLKYDQAKPNQTYPKWTCDDKNFENGHKDACMPPRRQKLCLHYLADTTQTSNITKPGGLKNAFIKCAAAETFLHWQYYKEHGDGKSKGLDQKLKDGDIPLDFLRSMMYTFGDYRDLCLDKDISTKVESKNKDVTTARKNIDRILKSHNGKDERKNFWDENAQYIWEGMLCGLSHTSGITDAERTNVQQQLKDKYGYDTVTFDTTTGSSTTSGKATKLSEFVGRPQFLRWLTEWGENFCKKHKAQLATLKEKCEKCNATKDTSGKITCNKTDKECSECEPQCEKYKAFITQWKGNYDKQKTKYKTKKVTYQNSDNDVKDSKEAHDYINKQIKKICNKSENNISCDCMEKKSEKSTPPPNSDMPQTLDTYPPGNYENQCTCEQKPPEKPKCTGNKILDAANMRQHEVASRLHESGDGDKLRGDLSKAEFKNKNTSKAPQLESYEYCNLDKKKHTNDVRYYKDDPTGGDEHHGPCTGKGKGTGTDTENQRFIIGQEWKHGTDKEMRTGHTGVLLPPRRKHMCTSNLENLGNKGGEPELLKRGNVNHSFLGDVLLAAKYEGDDIVHKLSSKSDIPGICNAMKYSFADLGDIIRGRDLWEKNDDMKQLEQHLVKIFERIQQNLPGPTKDKYKSGSTETPPYKTLREAWWNANRDQVWKALTCSAPTTANLFIPSRDTTEKKWQQYMCGRESYVPPDDYIPQRLRWMTEWSESYCKQLERNFWWVKAFCQACQKSMKTKGKSDTTVCERCRANCKVYTEHVNKWKGDWTKLNDQYNELYNPNGKSGTDEIKKQHEKFLQDIKGTPDCDGAKTDTNKYDSLSDYVTSMGGSTYCNDTTQNKFNEEKSEEHVFQQKPKNYKTECDDTKQKPPGQPKGPKKPDTSQPDPCTIVKGILEKNNGNDPIDSCNPKTQNGQEYPEWDCENKQNLIQTADKGACMPPRRQKLCIHDLTVLKDNDSKDKLREAFIKCAAKETFFSWHYYKNKNGGTNGGTELDEELKKGNIPPDFLRSMFFTYGDFRDLCLGKDIGISDDTKKIGQTVEKILNNRQTPEDWWDDNGLDIWKGMLCGLSYAIKDQSEQSQVQNKLTTKKEYQYDSDNLNFGITNYILYAHTIPQFLRWYTEWADEFCIEQSKQFVQLYEKCKTCNGKTGGKTTCTNKGDCDKCKQQCKKYTKFIEKWGNHYKEQQKKFDTEKNSNTYQYVPLVDSNTPAYQYLYESLELLGLHNNCMQHTSKITTNVGMPQALDQYPPDKDEYEKKCTCVEDTTTPGSVSPGGKAGPDGGKPQGGGKTPDVSPPGPVGPGGGPSPNPDPSHPGSSTATKEACDIVKEISWSTDETKTIEECNRKDKTLPYPPWKCGDQHKDLVNDDKVCMPPRRQKLCINNLTKLDPTKHTKEDLREALLKCAAVETFFAWNYYKTQNGGKNGGTQLDEDLKKGNIPPEFKRQMMYTFGDFKDLITGNDLGNHTGNNDIKKKVKDILEKDKPGGQAGGQQPEDWWNSIEKDVWKGMLCALKHASGSKDDKIKTNNAFDTVTFDGKTKVSTFADRPQFLRWMTEWYDDYCKQKHTKLEAVMSACKPQSGIKCDSDCDKSCQDYTTFMGKRKEHWEKQSKYYSTKKSGTNPPSDYDKDDAKDYLKHHITFTCGDTSSGTTSPSGNNPVENNIDALTPQASPYYDADVYCGCKKYIDESEYKTISGQSNCGGLQNKANGSNGIKWDSAGGGYSYLKTSGLSENVFIPPRRQHICFKNLDESKEVKDKSSLLKQLLKDAATEGYNLGQYYKEKDENKNDEKYKYDVEPCRAMKYSFLDLRDIILGTDNLEPPDKGTETNLKTIFEKVKTETGGSDIHTVRKQWWENNKKCVWEAMKCGYKSGRDGNSGTTESEKDLQNCGKDPPSDKDFPLGDDRESGKNLQFLRWFAEWGEDYCGHYTRELETLRTECPDTTCTGGDPNQKQKCNKACENYTKFITQWKEQYEKQKTKFDAVKNKPEIKKAHKDIENKTAYEFLNEKCFNNSCDCMKEKSTTSPSDDIPKSLDDVTKSDYQKQCECQQVVPTPAPPNPNPAHPAQNPKGTDQGQNPSQPGGASQPDGTPVSPGGSHQPSGPVSPVSPTKPPENMNCVEEAANKIREDVVNKVDSKLKGDSNNINGDCNKIEAAIKDNNGNKTIDKDKLTKQFPEIENSCENVGKDRFNVEKKWNCVKLGRTGKDICIPPRREHMCIKKINDMMSFNVRDKDELLKEVMKAAQEEGIDILRKLKLENQNEFYNICDAMKYSFADIGDIIRGRDLLNKDPKRQRGVETRMKNIFGKIYSLNHYNEPQYMYDPTHLKLREAWWNTNRKEVWKAMTCVAPDDAKFQKKDTNGNITSSDVKCGYNVTTPVDDYIPQKFRWLTEWSENYCKAKHEVVKKLKDKCVKCTKNSSCEDDDTDGTKCKECKKTCESLSKFVQQWKEQLNIQSSIYKELYKKANNSGTPPSSDDQDTKFLQKVKEKCTDKTKTTEEYLDKTNNCKEYKFTNNNNDETYALNEKPPKQYEDKCECTVPDPLEQCPSDQTTYSKICTNMTIKRTCDTKHFNNDLNNWTSDDVKNTIPNHKGVLVPPRRRYLCLKYITRNLDSTTNKDNFKKILLEYVFNEGYYLYDKYKNQPEKALQAMKYSFADYGDIVKGNDMIEGRIVDELNEKLKKIFPNNDGSSTNSTDNRKQWWNNNKKHVWHAMLCGYKSQNKNNGHVDSTWCNVPSDDNTDQFLRWLEEWAKIFCKEKVDEAKTVVDECIKKNNIKDAKTISDIKDTNCKKLLSTYRDWYLNRNTQWNGLKEAYQKYKTNNGSSGNSQQLPSEKDAEDYVKKKCPECNCKYDDLQKISQYEKDAENVYKELVLKAKIDTFDFTKKLFYNLFTLDGKGPEIVKNVIQATPKILPKVMDFAKDVGKDAAKIGIGTGMIAGTSVFNGIQHIINSITNSSQHPQPPPPPPPVAPLVPGGKQTPQSPITPPTSGKNPNNLVTSTIVPPVGISFVLGSIALLFYYMK